MIVRSSNENEHSTTAGTHIGWNSGYSGYFPVNVFPSLASDEFDHCIRKYDKVILLGPDIGWWGNLFHSMMITFLPLYQLMLRLELSSLAGYTLILTVNDQRHQHAREYWQLPSLLKHFLIGLFGASEIILWQAEYKDFDRVMTEMFYFSPSSSNSSRDSLDGMFTGSLSGWCLTNAWTLGSYWWIGGHNARELGNNPYQHRFARFLFRRISELSRIDASISSSLDENSPHLVQHDWNWSYLGHQPHILIDTRRDAQREVINCNQIIELVRDVFHDNDITVHVLDGHIGSAFDGILLFAHANIIIAPHGAGLTNLFFQPPRSVLIEYVPPNLSGPSTIRSCYRNMAVESELFYMVAPPDREGLWPDPSNKERSYLDIQQLRLRLEAAKLHFHSTFGWKDVAYYQT